MTVVNFYGTEIDFDNAVTYMDDEIREELHEELAPCEAHEAKYGEEWELAKANPVY